MTWPEMFVVSGTCFTNTIDVYMLFGGCLCGDIKKRSFQSIRDAAFNEHEAVCFGKGCLDLFPVAALHTRYEKETIWARGDVHERSSGSAGLMVLFFTLLPQELAPMEDRGRLRVNSTAPEGTSFERMDMYMDGLVDLIRTEVPEVDAVIANTSGFAGRPSIHTSRKQFP